MKQTIRSLAAVMASLTLVVPVASAQTPPPDPVPPSDGAGEDQAGKDPWDLVSSEDKDKASQLFLEGVQYLDDFNYNAAVDSFTEALKHMDHPTIHYNRAVALSNIAEPLEVYRELELALKYEGRGLEPDVYEEALKRAEVLLNQLVRVTVTCNQPDAKVVIDGADAGTCKDKQEQLLRAGEHSFTATKPGYESGAVTKRYMGGDTDSVTLKLIKPEELVRYKRRFEPWIPWAITGAGAVVTSVAGILHLSARNDFDEFRQAIIECGGCVPTQELRDLESGAETKQNIAIVGYVIGSAALVGGIALLVLNRPQPYRVEEQREPTGTAGMTVVPVVGREGVGVAATIRF